MNRLILCAVFALTGMLLGCGKKGDPSPPEFFAPASVATLVATPKAEGVLLSWDAPTETVRGERLIDLAQFEIRRGVFVKGEPPRFQDLATVPVNVDAQSGAVAKSYIFKDASAELGRHTNTEYSH